MDKVKKATECFNAGFSCSQAVLFTYAEQYGLSPDLALTVSRAFGGGMGGMGAACGAVTGAFMVLGLQYDAADRSAKGKIYENVQEFARRFRQRNQVLECNKLLGLDIGSKEGKVIFKENNMKETHCEKYVRDAVEILEELL